MRKVLMALLFAVSAVACTNKEDVEILPEDDDKIYATLQKFERSDTKVQLSDTVAAVWNSGDIIRIFNSGKVSDYKFDGKTGDQRGSFTWLSDNDTCVGPDSVAYAVYPVESYIGHRAKGNFTISVNLKEVQMYKKDSFGEGVNIMVGKSTDSVNYSFKNFLGYLCLSITGDKRVKSITVKGNGFEDTAGDLYFFADNPSTWLWTTDGEIFDETTIDCGDEGVLLSETEPTLFYVAFPPIIFGEGLTATIQYADGTIYPQSTTEIIEIEQNHIFAMETINTSATQWQTAKIYHSSASIETPIIGAQSGVTSLSGFVNYGDGNIITLSDLENIHNYNDGKESHVVTIQVKDATTVTLNSCKGVSKIDFSNF